MKKIAVGRWQLAVGERIIRRKKFCVLEVVFANGYRLTANGGLEDFGIWIWDFSHSLATGYLLTKEVI